MEVPAIDFVHCGEVAHVLKEHGRPDYLLDAAAGGGQNSQEILENPVSLERDVSCDKGIGHRVECDLPGDEHESVGLDGLRVGADGSRAVFGCDHVAHGEKPLSSQFSVLSSQFSVLSSQFSVLSSQFSVLSSQFSVLSSQFSVLSSQFSVL